MTQLRNREIAIKVNPHEQGLIRTAARRLGETPGAWARRQLIETAMSEIVAHNLTVEETE